MVVQVDVDALEPRRDRRRSSPSSSRVTVQPSCWRISRSASPAWVVDAGQSRTTTRPPVTAASARNGAALDRSGSMRWSTGFTTPGATAHRFASESSTSTPCSRSIATVMSMWGSEGTGLPSWRRSTPSSYRAPASSSAETNCEDADASMTTRPPRTEPVPRISNGRAPRPSSTTSTPRVRRAASTSPIGRERMCGSPSKATVPLDRPAAGGTNRITVPASPQSTCASRSNRPGATDQSGPEVSTVEPRLGQRRGHQERVPGPQRPAYDGRAVGERGEQQRPVGQRLAAGQRDDGVDRPGRPRCGPVLAQLR